ncbi:MAG: immunoglobulin domain-containing protein [Verrucomicrobiae bacterium]|nr:immunoglobulin domain-containing protein [Verrucomicrobiae bacterium]
MKPPYKISAWLGSTMLLAWSAMMTVGADYQSTVLSQGPVGYYRLNETVQPVSSAGAYATNVGSLGAGADGSYVSSPVLGFPGPFAGVNSVDLNGLSQYISTPSSAALDTTNFTFELWAKPAQAPKFAYLASSVDFGANRSGWYLAQDDGATFGAGSAWVVRIFTLNGAGFGGQVAAPISGADVWVHLAVTYDDTSKELAIYTNGVLAQAVTTTPGANGLTYVPNQNPASPLTVGARSTANFFWPGNVAQAAVYGSALSPARLAAHYAAATSAGTYSAAVAADSPLLYHNYSWPIPAPIAANLGTLGSAGNGLFLPGSIAAVPGPVPPVYPGFAATNKAAAFIGDGGAVRLPALNLNANTITISAWVNATNAQKLGAGLVVNGAGSGLIIDGAFGDFGLGYYWNNTAGTYNWSPSADAGLPALPNSEWAFAALVVQPTEANIYIGLTNGGNITFSGVTNFFSHVSQTFSSATLVGSDAGDPDYSFNGAIDEVAIWQRALSSGELYTQFASAVDGVAAAILTDLVGPDGPAAVGDPLVLSVNAGGTPPLVYTWFKDTVAIATTTNSGTFTIASADLDDAGTYEVTVTNSFGSASSQPVSVMVVNPAFPVIVGQEGFYASRVLYPTGTLHLAVSATGGGLKYQWYKDGTAIPAATDSSYRVANVTAANAGSYTVVVTNSMGAVTNGPAGITIATVVPGSYEAAIVASGPQAWWRLDESAGATILFDAVGRHDGIYTNITGEVPLPTLGVAGALVGNDNTAVSFNGSGGVGLAPFSPELNPGKFSVELWVRTSDLAQLGVPASASDSGGGWAWLANAGNWNGYSPSDNGVAPLQNYPEYGATIAPGVWTHLVIAYDETVIIDGSAYPYRYWINGGNAGYVWQGDPATTSGPFIIGGTDPAIRANRFFNGQVDEIAVYPRVLTATEITNHITARGVELIVPTFTSHPLPQTVTVGKSVTFSASAVGSPTPLDYQWFKDGTPISLATENSYTIPGVALTDAGVYSLRATNVAGTNFSTAASLVVIPATGYANVTNDLVLHLRFDGDTQDSSGKGNNGTPSSSPAPDFVAGQIGSQAAEFTTILSGSTVSSASYVDLGTPTDLLFGSDTSFSVGLWVKLATDATPPDLPFIGTEIGAANNSGWFVGPAYETGGWQWNLNDGVNNFGVSGPANSINSGQWHNFIITVDRLGGVVNSYLDGLLVSSRSIAGLGSVDGGGAVTIGQDPTYLYPEAGTFALDDIGIWRRALTAMEVAQIASAGAAGRSFDTVAPPSVTLTITRSDGNLILNYSSGTLLQSSDLGPTAVWTPVPGASAPSTTITPTNAANYYRVLLD